MVIVIVIPTTVMMIMITGMDMIITTPMIVMTMKTAMITMNKIWSPPACFLHPQAHLRRHRESR